VLNAVHLRYFTPLVVGVAGQLCKCQMSKTGSDAHWRSAGGCKLGHNSIILFEKPLIFVRRHEIMDNERFPKFWQNFGQSILYPIRSMNNDQVYWLYLSTGIISDRIRISISCLCEPTSANAFEAGILYCRSILCNDINKLSRLTRAGSAPLSWGHGRRLLRIVR
jgi:hypothetical protein